MELHVRKNVADAVLGQLLHVIRARAAMQQNPVGSELNVQILQPVARPGSDVALQFTTQHWKILQ